MSYHFKLYKRVADNTNIGRDAAWVARAISDDPHRTAHRLMQLWKLDQVQQKKSAVLDQEQQARRIAMTLCANETARRARGSWGYSDHVVHYLWSQVEELDERVQRNQLKLARDTFFYEKFLLAQEREIDAAKKGVVSKSGDRPRYLNDYY